MIGNIEEKKEKEELEVILNQLRDFLIFLINLILYFTLIQLADKTR